MPALLTSWTRGAAPMRWRLVIVTTLTLASAALWPCAVEAQISDGLLAPPLIPEGFDRGRNVSVAERPHPGYDPIGQRLGSFTLYPSIEAGGGATSNVYLNSDDEVAAPYLYAEAIARLQSNWSRHSLSVRAQGQDREYIGQSRARERTWSVNGTGRADLGRFNTVTLELEASQLLENQFTGEVIPTIAALSRYRLYSATITGVRAVGRTRFTAAADYNQYIFAPVPLLTGGTRDQSTRDRSIARLAGQGEYAFTPSLSAFAQLSYAAINYDKPLAADVPNRDSTGYRALAGVNFDLAGRARGSFGVGYTKRDPRSALYQSASGFSAEARVDLFPSYFTTVSVTARRILQDTTLNTAFFFDNRIGLGVDHELLRNLILHADTALNHQTFVGTDRSVDYFQFGTGARFTTPRRLALEASARYNKRTGRGSQIGGDYDEFRLEAGVRYQI